MLGFSPGQNIWRFGAEGAWLFSGWKVVVSLAITDFWPWLCCHFFGEVAGLVLAGQDTGHLHVEHHVKQPKRSMNSASALLLASMLVVSQYNNTQFHSLSSLGCIDGRSFSFARLQEQEDRVKTYQGHKEHAYRTS